MSTTMLHVRIDERLKAEAATALSAMGLTVSDAVKLLLTRVVSDQAFPFELKVPNAKTRAAIEEARGIGKARFTDAGKLFDDLEKRSRR